MRSVELVRVIIDSHSCQLHLLLLADRLRRLELIVKKLRNAPIIRRDWIVNVTLLSQFFHARVQLVVCLKLEAFLLS